ncbi:hypothetical protein T4D_15924 [Trichinella pseudospiralis]|uniref:Uncharacterized protein n=1 Tax=Trichinella pseudospiralis TaxID=6337 RepID=A0A0V1FGH0_TRIPS|nr:hypothetical protein T4D_15924 [Trichinella pseudospiralis]
MLGKNQASLQMSPITEYRERNNKTLLSLRHDCTYRLLNKYLNQEMQDYDEAAISYNWFPTLATMSCSNLHVA